MSRTSGRRQSPGLCLVKPNRFGYNCEVAPTILQREGFSVKVNTRDHLPAHVHVWKDGKEARFAIESGTVTLLSTGDMTNAELRRAAEIIYAERTLIAKALRKMPWVPKL